MSRWSLDFHKVEGIQTPVTAVTLGNVFVCFGLLVYKEKAVLTSRCPCDHGEPPTYDLTGAL